MARKRRRGTIDTAGSTSLAVLTGIGVAAILMMIVFGGNAALRDEGLPHF